MSSTCGVDKHIHDTSGYPKPANAKSTGSDTAPTSMCYTMHVQVCQPACYLCGSTQQRSVRNAHGPVRVLTEQTFAQGWTQGPLQGQVDGELVVGTSTVGLLIISFKAYAALCA